jgi:hypothetical protein
MDHKKTANQVYEFLFPYPEASVEDSLNRLFHITQDIPQLHFADDHIVFPEQKTFTITDPLSLQPLATFDAEAITDTNNFSSNLLIQPNHFIYREGNQISDFVISEEKTTLPANKDFLNYLFYLLAQIPSMEIESGILKLKGMTSHDITDIGGTPLITIDTANKSVSKDTILTLTDTHIYLSDTLSTAYADLTHEGIRNTINATFKAGKTLALSAVLLLFLPGMTIATFLTLLAITFISALLTQSIFQLVNRRAVNYKGAFRITALAMVPALILNTLFPPLFLSQGLVYLMILVGYIYLGVKANSETNV